MTTRPATKAEAIAALRAAGFTVTDPEGSVHERTLVHCMLGGFGADWNLAAALGLVKDAERVEWVTDDLLDHPLLAHLGGKRYRFRVQAPPAPPAPTNGRPEHLTPAETDRGFATMPTLAGPWRGETVTIWESSNADGPHLWIKATEQISVRGTPMTTAVSVELDAETAWKLADQLRAAVTNHYQGDGRPDWARAETNAIKARALREYADDLERGAAAEWNGPGHGPLPAVATDLRARADKIERGER